MKCTPFLFSWETYTEAPERRTSKREKPETKTLAYCWNFGKNLAKNTTPNTISRPPSKYVKKSP
jgi:hypothetical protein